MQFLAPLFSDVLFFSRLVRNKSWDSVCIFICEKKKGKKHVKLSGMQGLKTHLLKLKQEGYKIAVVTGLVRLSGYAHIWISLYPAVWVSRFVMLSKYG